MAVVGGGLQLPAARAAVVDVGDEDQAHGGVEGAVAVGGEHCAQDGLLAADHDTVGLMTSSSSSLAVIARTGTGSW
ncbi:hypothetical protein ACIOGZ_29950 [Kitasatospora sp. NPDC088160]|uniref:hypothetical protein n=1 Tax=Kitasatospora sp. NPDC088160 TaxID=3364072 RepID=UPI00381A0748